MPNFTVLSKRSASPSRAFRTTCGLIVCGLIVVANGCGAASSNGDGQSTPARSTAQTSTNTTQCPTGDALIARVRQLEKHGKDEAIRRWAQRIQAGPGNQQDNAGALSGCAGFQTLSDSQTITYVDMLYNGRSAMADALVLHQTDAAQRAILDAYRKDPDAVTDNPGLAAAVAMAQIQQGQSYQSAYQDLAFAALNDGIAPRYVRGYLSHFGCNYEDAVWAVKTKQTEDFFAGDAFPASTRPSDVDRADLVEDRMALLQRGEVPSLRDDCPLSVQYAADHNGDTMMRLKLKAKRLKDQLNEKLDDYADKLIPGHDDSDQDHSSSQAPNEKSTVDDIQQQLVENYAQLKGITLQAGTLAGDRWDACADELSHGFEAIVDCLKNGQGHTDHDDSDSNG